MNAIVKVIIVIFLLHHSLDSFSQSKIDVSKKELKDGAKKSNTRSRSSSSSSPSCSDGCFSDFMTEIVLYVTYYSIIGIYEEEEHLHNYLSKYPYYNKSSGNYESPDSHSSIKTVRLDLEDKLLLNFSDLYGNHLKAKLRPTQYFYFQIDYFQFWEYNKNERAYSYLSLFNFNVCYDRIRSKYFNLGWTLGANYIGNEVNEWGFSCGVNTELFPFNPISLYSSMKWGLVNHVPVNEFEVLCKYHIKNGFFCIGYERLKIATPTYDYISTGLGIYF